MLLTLTKPYADLDPMTPWPLDPLHFRYLEELSQRYRRQMEQMYLSLNKTIQKLSNTSRTAEQRVGIRWSHGTTPTGCITRALRSNLHYKYRARIGLKYVGCVQGNKMPWVAYLVCFFAHPIPYRLSMLHEHPITLLWCPSNLPWFAKDLLRPKATLAMP